MLFPGAELLQLTWFVLIALAAFMPRGIAGATCATVAIGINLAWIYSQTATWLSRFASWATLTIGLYLCVLNLEA